MDFEKYQHVERFGKDEVAGIEDGTCYVFPKIDGTNASVWWDGGVRCGSRNRYLVEGEDNQGFKAWALAQDNIREFLKVYPRIRLYGEWLVPHTIKDYRPDAWRKFYVFDVLEDGKYVRYNEYKPLLESFDIDYIPCIRMVVNGSKDQFYSILDTVDYLMPAGHIGEGIVIKRYDFVNKYGRVTWAKIVRSEFKEAHVKAMQPGMIMGRDTVEQAIADCVTQALVDKERAKIDTTPIQPRLLGTVWHCLLTEELAHQIKKHKNPTIDFKLLQRFVTSRVKELASDLF